MASHDERGLARQPGQELLRRHSRVAKNFGEDSAPEVLTAMVRNGRCSSVPVSEELVAAFLAGLRKTQGLQVSVGFSSPGGVEPGQQLPSTCCQASNVKQVSFS